MPSGTVTFLFTDLEGSTRLWEQHPDAMRDALARHDAILDGAIDDAGGVVFSRMGDGMAAAFASAGDAVAAAVGAQRALDVEPWPDAVGALRARMGIHTGEGVLVEGQYLNQPLNRCARLMAIGHGGQVLLSGSAEALVRDQLPDDVRLADLGDHRLRDLSEPLRVFQADAAHRPTGFPPLKSLDAFPGNLPRQMTSFVGRDAEVAAIAELVRTRPLVTLTGVGGVGKTRLALEVAGVVIADFVDGAWLCELAPVTDPDAVWTAVADTFRVLPSPGRAQRDALLDYLATKRLVLVLDNCEHLLDAAAQVVKAIARGCPRVTVLATSREGLAVAGEQMVAVPSLAVEVEDDASGLDTCTQLFLDRARSAASDFEASPRNLAAVGVLCRRLDGIPLAIELAAARAASLSPEDLVARLDQRFKLLASRNRSMDRHHTLRTTIDWSYDLLDDEERGVLQGLSVFAGGADLDAAESVLSSGDLDPVDVVDLVAQLVDKSLVLAERADEGSRRYRMLETIRQYAQERLEATGGAATVRTRHAEHYVALAESAGPGLRSREQLAWARRIAPETDNLRVAFDWAVATADPALALRVVAALAVTGPAIGYAAMEWAEIAADLPGADRCSQFAEVVSWAARSASMRSDFEAGRAFAARADAAQQALEHPSVAACVGPAAFAFLSGDIAEARCRADEWIALARDEDDQFELSNGLSLLGAVEAMLGNDEGSWLTHEEHLRVARASAIPSVLVTALLGRAADSPGHDDAEALLDECIQVGSEIGDRFMLSNALVLRGSITESREGATGALRAAVAAAEQWPVGGFVYVLAALGLAGLGHPEPGAEMLGAGRARLPDPLVGWVQDLAVRAESALTAHLTPERLDELTQRGAGLDLADAYALLTAAAARALAESAAAPQTQ